VTKINDQLLSLATGISPPPWQTPSTGLTLVYDQTPNTGLRRRSTWSRVPESDVRSVVHDILPRTTAITGYAIGLGKLSANGQFFVGTQMALSLQQTTQVSGFFLFLVLFLSFKSQAFRL